MCPTLLTCSFVTFDRKIKRSDLNVVIGYLGSRASPKFRYRLRAGNGLCQCLSDQLRSYVVQ